MKTVHIKTGIGYIKDTTSGVVVAKYSLPPGEHRLEDGFEAVEAADQATLDGIVVGLPYNTTPSAVAGLQKKRKKAEIRSNAADALKAIVKPYGPEERETWDAQQREARAYLSAQGADTPMLSAMAVARGISLDEMVSKVMTNVARFEAAAGHVLGQQQNKLDQLDAIDSDSPGALDAINSVDTTISPPAVG